MKHISVDRFLLCISSIKLKRQRRINNGNRKIVLDMFDYHHFYGPSVMRNCCKVVQWERRQNRRMTTTSFSSVWLHLRKSLGVNWKCALYTVAGARLNALNVNAAARCSTFKWWSLGAQHSRNWFLTFTF